MMSLAKITYKKKKKGKLDIVVPVDKLRLHFSPLWHEIDYVTKMKNAHNSRYVYLNFIHLR